jgi:hypothetical protein
MANSAQTAHSAEVVATRLIRAAPLVPEVRKMRAVVAFIG